MITPCEYKFMNVDGSYCSVIGADCEYQENRTCPIHLEKKRSLGQVMDTPRVHLDLGIDMGIWQRFKDKLEEGFLRL